MMNMQLYEAKDLIPKGKIDWLLFLSGFVLMALAVFSMTDFPVYALELILAATAYFIALLFFPYLWLFVLPVLNVTLDLTSWSGRVFFNEFDLFLMATMAAIICSRQLTLRMPKSALALTLAFVALNLFQSLSTNGIPDYPTSSIHENPYYMDAYAFKISKGILAGLFLAINLTCLYLRNPYKTAEILSLGFSIGAITLGCVILWERGTLYPLLTLQPWWAIASSVLDLSSSYRITGIFSDMHTGGEVIDGIVLLYLSATLYGLFYCQRTTIRALALVASASLFYVTLVGFTRATYVSVALLCLAFGLMFLIHNRNKKNIKPLMLLAIALVSGVWLSRLTGSTSGISLSAFVVLSMFTLNAIPRLPKNALLLLAVTVICVAALLSFNYNLNNRWVESTTGSQILSVAVTIVLGASAFFSYFLSKSRFTFNEALSPIIIVLLTAATALSLGGYKINERMDTVNRDLETRINHWNSVLDSSEKDLLTKLFGNGVGSFPKNYVAANPDTLKEIGSMHIDNNGLVLGKGVDLAFGQRVNITPNTNYSIEIVYSAEKDSKITVFLCERNLIFASNFISNCSATNLWLKANSHQQLANKTLNSKKVGLKPIYGRWPTIFYMKNLSKENNIVTLHNVSMIEEEYKERKWNKLKNNDFKQGLDNWYFFNDYAHLPWHIKNTWVQQIYDTGYIGLFLFTLVLFYAAAKSYINKKNTQLHLSLIIGVITLTVFGLFGTPLDSPRVSWVFYTLLIFAAVSPTVSNKGATPP